MSHAVMLAAAVTPHPRVSVAVSDPGQRLQQYVEAIGRWRSYSATTGSRVLVVETTRSAQMLQDQLRAHGDEAEVIDFVGPEELFEKGKGSVDSAALDHGAAHLAASGIATITKVTGRLWISNAIDAISPLQPKSVMVRRTLDRRFVDTRLIHASTDVWTTDLIGMAAEVNEPAGVWQEHVIALRLIRAEHERGVVVERFPARPKFRGQSGTNGDRYDGPVNAVRTAVLGRAERFIAGLATKQV